MKNWLATAISGLIVSLSMVASAEPTGLALCELLTKTPRYDEENSERVETKGLSFLVPRGMKEEELESVDSESHRWKQDELEIGYGGINTRPIAGVELTCDLGAVGGVAKFVLSENGRWLAASFPDALEDSRSHTVAVGTADRGEALRILRWLLESTRFVNKAENLVIETVSRDLSSFQYRNEIGDIRTGKLGDTVTRDFGRVDRIGECAVEVTELLPDGAGGWEKFPRVIPVMAKGENCSPSSH